MSLSFFKFRSKVTLIYTIIFIIGAMSNIYTTVGELSSKFDEFLAVRSQFDSEHGVDFYAPTCCQSAIFVPSLFAFYCPFFLRKKVINNVAFRPRRDVYAA